MNQSLYTSKLFRDKTEAAGIPFFPLPEEADQAVLDKIADFLKRNRYAPGPERACRCLSPSSSIPCPSSFEGCRRSSGSFRLICSARNMLLWRFSASARTSLGAPCDAYRGPGSNRAIFYSKNSATLCFNQLQTFGSRPLPGIGRHGASLKALNLAAD
jgi:hypothetical protein